MRPDRTIVALGWEPWQSPPRCSLAELLSVAAREATVVWVNPQLEWGETSQKEYFARIHGRTALRPTPEGVLVIDPPPLPPVGFRYLPRRLRTPWTLTVIKLAKEALARSLRQALGREGLRPRVLVVTEPFDLVLAGRLGEELAVYYVYDETTLIPGLESFREALARAEESGLKRVAVVFTSSLAQANRRQGLHSRVIPLANGVSPQRYAKLEPIPDDLAAIPAPRLVVVGQIDFRLDSSLVASVAACHPEWAFVFVGPARSTGREAVRRLSGYPNVHFLGHRDPSLLGAYQAGSQVGLIPFMVNEATCAMRPLRLLGYLACGLPVVSVPLPELAAFVPHVREAAEPEAFAAEISAALTEDGPSARAMRRRLALAESWEGRLATFWWELGLQGSDGMEVDTPGPPARGSHALPADRTGSRTLRAA